MHLHSEERHVKPKYAKLDFGDSHAAKDGLLACILRHCNSSDLGGKLDPLEDKASILLNAHHKGVSSIMTYLSDLWTLQSLQSLFD
jgi:hypothetical protein